MSGFVVGLLAVFAGFMLCCGVTGYRRSFLGFVTVLISGWSLNLVWMTFALNAKPLESNALIAQAALAGYGFCGFATGFMISRFVRAFRATAVEDDAKAG